MAKNYFTSSLTKLPVIDKNHKKGYSKSDPFLDGFNAEHYSSLPKEIPDSNQCSKHPRIVLRLTVE